MKLCAGSNSGDSRPVGSAAGPAARGRKRPDRRPKDLTWKEERELETLPGRIEDLELELSGLQQELSDPELYRKEGSFVAARKAELAAKEADLASTYARWEELESKRDLLRE